MAVTHDNISSPASAAGAVTSLTTPAFTIGAGSNRAGAIGVSHGGNTATAFLASIGGTSCALVSGTDSGTATTPRSLIFACPAPPSGSQTATVSWTTSQVGTICAETVSGADQTTPMNNGTFGSGTASNPSLSITSTNGDLTLDTVAVDTGSVSSPTQTNRWNDSSAFYGAGSTGPGTGTSTHGWTLSSGNYAQSGANFRQPAAAASVAGPLTTPRLILTDRVLVTGGGLPQAFAPRKTHVYPWPASFEFPAQNVPPLGQATPDVMRLRPFRAAPFLARVVPAVATQTVTFDPALMAAMSGLGPTIVISQPQAVASGMTPPDNIPN